MIEPNLRSSSSIILKHLVGSRNGYQAIPTVSLSHFSPFFVCMVFRRELLHVSLVLLEHAGGLARNRLRDGTMHTGIS